MLRAVISDHAFPSVAVQRRIVESAGFEFTEADSPCVTENDVIERCTKADVLLVQWAPITRHVLKSLPGLTGVVRYGIGVDNIDLDAARELGVAVANVSTYCLEEVSNHTLALILSLARRIPQDHYRIAHGDWGIVPLLPIAALADMTLGLIGFGSVARRVAKKAQVFGLKIMATDPYTNDSVFTQQGVERVQLDRLIGSADILSLHCPLIPETAHLIRRDTLDKMKRGVFIINTSRGGVIREPDLIEALVSGQVLGAGLDVFEKEPLPTESPLRRLSNVLLTSHAASVSTRAIETLQIKAAESACEFLRGRRAESTLVWPTTSPRISEAT